MLSPEAQPRRPLEAKLDHMSRGRKQTLAIVVDCLALPLALYLALALRLGDWSPPIVQFWPAFAASVLGCIPIFMRLGLYRQMVRYMGNHAMASVLKGVTVGALAVASVAYLVPLQVFPRSVPVIFWLLAVLFISGSRFMVRAYVQWYQGATAGRDAIIIFGAGSAGLELARVLLQQGDFRPVAFIDDDKTLHGRSVYGLTVYPRDALGDLLSRTLATQVCIAVPSGSALQRREIIHFLEPYGVRVRLIPNLSDLVSGRESVANVRDVAIEDILLRDEVEALPHLLARSVRGRVVMVTGAGGSIGSELSRQIAREKPELLVLLDQNEYGLYKVQKELEQLMGERVPLVTVLGSVTNVALMERTFRRYRPSTVYHAAAYKHVSLVENNVIQGLKNNTFGTLHTADAAISAGVRDFILISTDKAVRTSSVMGASKRMAEMILQALQEETVGTRFSIVRFGNVLGSSGSVVPLFIEQIERGGPVTVTHPEVTRYFMTIPEAAQLVLQAASMAEGGDIFVLDMGKPVKIVDLAERIIRLKGHTVRDAQHPSGDIDIEFTGLKPGEKLHEELLLGADVSGTEHRKILRATETFVPWKELHRALNTLELACDTYDYAAIKEFIEGLVEGADLEAQLGDLSPRAPVVHLPGKKIP